LRWWRTNGLDLLDKVVVDRAWLALAFIQLVDLDEIGSAARELFVPDDVDVKLLLGDVPPAGRGIIRATTLATARPEPKPPPRTRLPARLE